MKRFSIFFPMVAVMILGSGLCLASKQVTVDNYIRAETDMTMKNYVDKGAAGKFLHVRTPTPIDEQKVIRMNRDTIYSVGVFDLTEPLTIVKPDSEGRFQSMQVIDQDHFTIEVAYNEGEYKFTQGEVGTRYLVILVRTFIDANNPDDIQAANKLQDELGVRQESPGTFDLPDWDESALTKLRETINLLAATRGSADGMFGGRNQVDPISHLLGTAFGWGGNPETAAVYENVTPEKNDGKTPYTLTVSEKVPVDGFVSVTVYNAKGYMEKNKYNSYSVNNVTAERNEDGSVTIHFGGDPDDPNYLPITPGWNYVVRMYKPQEQIIDGFWTFPRPKPRE